MVTGNLCKGVLQVVVNCFPPHPNNVTERLKSRRRTQSQADSPDGAGPSSWESEQSNFHHPALGGVQEPQGGAQQQQQDHSTTPELCGEPHQGSPQPEKFFPLFRPVAQWKVKIADVTPPPPHHPKQTHPDKYDGNLYSQSEAS